MRVRAPLLLLVAAAGLLAQEQAGDLTISGVVTNAVSGEPILGALVGADQVPARPLENPQRPIHRLALSGSGGQFTVGGLVAGHYMVRIEKPGFHQAGITPDFQVNAPLTGVQLKLNPLGVIEGTAVDSNGEPLSGITIEALTAKVADGVRRVSTSRLVRTNDRGTFRIWGLLPGKYFVRASGRSGPAFRFPGEQLTYVPGTWESLLPMYATEAPDLVSATPIVIGPGTQARADFRLKMTPAFKIRGTLANLGKT